MFNRVATALTIAMLAALAVMPIDLILSVPDISVILILNDSILPNGVTIYGGNPAVQIVVNEFLTL